MAEWQNEIFFLDGAIPRRGADGSRKHVLDSSRTMLVFRLYFFVLFLLSCRAVEMVDPRVRFDDGLTLILLGARGVVALSA